MTTKTITNKDLKLLLEDINENRVDLDWDGDNGSYKSAEEWFEDDKDQIAINTKVELNVYGKTTSGDYESPDEWNESGRESTIVIDDIYVDGEEIELTEEQHEMVVKELEYKLTW